MSFVPGGRATLKRQPTEVQCRYSVATVGTAKVLQLDTGGSADRDYPGKVSQTLQIDEAAAAQLFSILRREFELS